MKEVNTTTATNITLDFDSLSSDIHVDVEDNLDELQITALGANAAKAGFQTISLQAAIDNYAIEMNRSAIASRTGEAVKTASAQWKGFAAEYYFEQTFKINALSEGVLPWKFEVRTKGQLPDNTTLTGTDMQTDIVVLTRKNPWSKFQRTAEYQSKMHNNPRLYKQDMANPQYKDVKFVGGSGQGVNDTVSAQIGSKTISSDSITPQAAEALADSMKAQDTPQYAKGAEKHDNLNNVKLNQAIAMGAATGAVLTTVKEIASIVKNKDNLSETQWIESIKNILCGTIEGGIRGGAIAGSVQLLGKALGVHIAETSLGAIPPMALANASIDIAKDLYKLFVTKTIDADDLLCNSVNNIFSSVAGFGGSVLGSNIAMTGCIEIGISLSSSLGFVGTILGASVGGLIIGMGASLIIKTANKDAQKAFNACVEDIKMQTQLSGVDQMYYFADAMSELSDFRLSFKNLLPCYNLISDLKEYNLRKKAIKNVRAQLESNLAAMDEKKRAALQDIEQQHRQRLAMLDSIFEDQRNSMYEQMGNSMKTYVENSYAQYVDTFSLCQFDIASLDFEREQALESHNAILASIEHRNEANRQLNIELDELMSDSESAFKVKPFVDRIVSVMNQDKLITEKQYISFDEAMKLQEGAV